MYAPPPPYVSVVQRDPSSKGIAALPLHLVHRILSLTLDQRATPSRFWSDPEEERVRRIWALFRGLRGVNRVFWLVCTSILRATYLEVYLSHVKPGYSSDPFPYESAQLADPSVDVGRAGSVYDDRGRETAVFDRFIAVQVGEELRTVESSLTEGSEALGDVFHRLQPAARIEDLLETLSRYIVKDGPATRSLPLPLTHLSVSLTPTWASLYLHSAPVAKRGSKELVVEARRTETLEGTVKRIGDGLDDIARRLAPWGGRVG
ncbi:hypothetical protein IAU60_004898 [Kwoniella sp. DSM 27419]